MKKNFVWPPFRLIIMAGLTLALMLSFFPMSAFANPADSSGHNDESDMEFNNARLKLAQQLGFKRHASLDDVYKILKNEGKQKAKTYLYFADGAIRSYRLNQKLNGYCSYVGDRYELPKIIVIKPFQGESLVKGSYLPGFYYEFLGTMKVTLLDGFSGNALVIHRVMTPEEKRGYGTPPNDSECKKTLMGTWLIDKTEFGTDRYLFRPDGTLTLLQYDMMDRNGESCQGTWSIRNRELLYSGNCESKDGISGSFENEGGKIIKITNSHLVLHNGKHELWFYREK